MSVVSRTWSPSYGNGAVAAPISRAEKHELSRLCEKSAVAPIRPKLRLRPFLSVNAGRRRAGPHRAQQKKFSDLICRFLDHLISPDLEGIGLWLGARKNARDDIPRPRNARTLSAMKAIVRTFHVRGLPNGPSIRIPRLKLLTEVTLSCYDLALLQDLTITCHLVPGLAVIGPTFLRVTESLGVEGCLPSLSPRTLTLCCLLYSDPALPFALWCHRWDPPLQLKPPR